MEPPQWAGTLLTSMIQEHFRIGRSGLSVIARTGDCDESGRRRRTCPSGAKARTHFQRLRVTSETRALPLPYSDSSAASEAVPFQKRFMTWLRRVVLKNVRC